jgi:hypothetical protein
MFEEYQSNGLRALERQNLPAAFPILRGPKVDQRQVSLFSTLIDSGELQFHATKSSYPIPSLFSALIIRIFEIYKGSFCGFGDCQAVCKPYAVIRIRPN